MNQQREISGFHESVGRATLMLKAWKKGTSLLALLLFLPQIGSCTAAESIATKSVVPEEYQIAPEDVLEISVWNEDNLKRTVLVLPDGHISFPMAGDLMAAGKTVPQLRDELATQLSRFVHDAQVFVSVEKTAGLRIYVLGEVQKPGQYTVGRYVDVLQALSLAGGLTPYAAKDQIQVLRREGNKNAVYRFDYSAIRKGKGLGQNIVLRSDDVVLVP